MDSPSAFVLERFGAVGKPQSLPGGQGTGFRVGSLFFKPVDSPVEASWTAELFEQISGPGFRVPRPCRSKDGAWVVEGLPKLYWTAWEWVEAEHVRGRGDEVLDACRAFHAALAPFPRAQFLTVRSDPWSIADRMAWGEEELTYSETAAPYVERLLPWLEPSSLPSQLIHGDIAGNVLFADGGEPCVIDFSPYWRPAEFAAAVMVVDSILWEGSDYGLVTRSGCSRQLLARGALRRILEHDLHHRLHGRATLSDLPYYDPLLDYLEF